METAATERNGLFFIWKIANFSYFWHGTNEEICSPKFPKKKSRFPTWTLKLFPKGCTTLEDRLVVRLCREHDVSRPVALVDFELCILDAKRCVVGDPVVKRRFFRAREESDSYVISNTDDVIRNKAADDTLRVRCRIWPRDNEMQFCVQYAALSSIGVEKSCFTWSLKAFSFLRVSARQGHIWEDYEEAVPTYTLEASVDAEDDQLKISVNLHRSFGCFMWVRVAVMDVHGNRNHQLQSEYTFPSNWGEVVARERFLLPPVVSKRALLSEKERYLPGDVLTLQFEIHVSHKVFTPDGMESFVCGSSHAQVEAMASDMACWSETSADSVDEPVEGSLSSDLGSLLQNGPLADFTLRVGLDAVRVHKAVLVARSSVFRAMITGDMVESTTHEADILDLDIDTVRSLVSFLYTDSLRVADCDAAMRLYFAADKYDVSALKTRVASYLRSNVSLENACRVLTLASRHGDEKLKKAVQDFVCIHDAEIVRSVWWEAFLEEEVQVAAEMMQIMCLKRTQ